MIISDLVKIVAELASVTGMDSVSDKIGEYLGNRKNMDQPKRTSIKNLSKDSILQYPILYTEDISRETMRIITKALEYDYANMMKIIITSQIVNTPEIHKSSDGNSSLSISDYLKKYHTNIERNNESLKLNDNAIKRELKNINESLLDRFEDLIESNSLNEYSLPTFFLEDKSSSNNNNNNDVFDITDADGAEMKLSMDAKTDIEKSINDLEPLILKATLQWKIPDADMFRTDVCFGIKGIAHLVDLPTTKFFVSNSVKDSNLALQYIRWTTGEIKFVKDIVLALDLNKEIAKTKRVDNYWWRKLTSMAKHSDLKSRTDRIRPSSVAKPIPTATLILSKQSVDSIKYNTGIDILNNRSIPNKIIENFFLLNFGIIDESINVFYLYSEISKEFESYDIEKLKLKTKDSSSIKELSDLIQVLRR